VNVDDYSIDFLVFKDLAEGRLAIDRRIDAGALPAELVAHTLGVASWLSGDRTPTLCLDHGVTCRQPAQHQSRIVDPQA